LWSKLQEAVQEVNDVSNSFQKEREELVNTVREYNVQIKLRAAIIDAFIPADEVEKIEKRAVWDEEHETWVLARSNVLDDA
jgi:kinesin family protein 3/17